MGLHLQLLVDVLWLCNYATPGPRDVGASLFS